MDFQKVIGIADRSKNISGGSDYALANVAFAALLQEFFNGAEGLELQLETNDQVGNDVFESYYDVVVMRAGESSLCIPLPILEVCTVATVCKRAQFVPRGVHSRQCQDGLTKEKAALWAELFIEVGTDRLTGALKYLAEETEQKVKTFVPEAV